MNTDKQYKLLKLYPSLPFNWEVGMILGQGDRGSRGSYSPCNGKYTDWYIQQDDVEKNPDYFTEVLPVSEPVKERVTVSIGSCAENYKFNNKTSFNTVFQTNIPITSELSPKVQQAIEKVLNNDTVVEDRQFIPFNKIMVDKDEWDKRRYSQSEVDTIRKELEDIIEVQKAMLQLQSKQPTNDNAFVWTDELVILLCDFVHHNGWHKNGKRIVEEFDEFKSINPKKRIIPDWIKKHIASKQSPPLSEIKEGNGWEILTSVPPDNKTWTVLRKSDKQTFTVGQFNNGKTIEKFFIGWNGMEIHYTDGSGSLLLEEPYLPKLPTTPAKAIVVDKPVLFTTEDGVPRYKGDNCWAVQHPNFVSIRWVDICEEGMRDNLKYFFTKEATEKYILENKPCLSLNDLQNEWFTKDEQVQFGTWDGIPMYRRLKSIVKEKLK